MIYILVIALFNQTPTMLNVFSTGEAFKQQDACYSRASFIIKQLALTKHKGPGANYVVRCVETKLK